MHLRYSTLVVSQLFIESVAWDILGQYDDVIRILFPSLLSSFIEKRFPRELMGQDVWGRWERGKLVSVKDKTNVIMVVQDFIAFVGIYGGFGQRHFRDMFQLNPLILSRGSHFSNSSCLKVKTVARINCTNCTNRTNCTNCISYSRWKESLRPLPAEQMWVRFKSWYMLSNLRRALDLSAPSKEERIPRVLLSFVRYTSKNLYFLFHGISREKGGLDD